MKPLGVDDLLDTLIAELREQGRHLRELNLHVSSLGSCMGHGLEQVVKESVEEFAGQAFSHAERLVLRDETEVHTGLAIFAQRLEKVEIRGRRGRDSSR
ncbi:MAG TPA: hypothetical protein VE844_05535, partial [Gammaproteobacteria bacterium]|nr:hypothetical protein [Gammaproteobacteria bacterium]